MKEFIKHKNVKIPQAKECPLVNNAMQYMHINCETTCYIFMVHFMVVRHGFVYIC